MIWEPETDVLNVPLDKEHLWKYIVKDQMLFPIPNQFQDHAKLLGDLIQENHAYFHLNGTEEHIQVCKVLNIN